MESTWGPAHAQCMVEAISGPALVISRDGIVLAANPGVARLTGLSIYDEEPRSSTMHARRIQDLGWALVPVTKPVHRDWTMLLDALDRKTCDMANQASQLTAARAVPRSVPHGTRRRSKEFLVTDEFWDDEERRHVVEDTDVFINLKTVAQRMSSSTRCRLRIKMCFVGQQKLKVFLIRFMRPPNQDLAPPSTTTTQDDGVSTSAILKPSWTPDNLIHEGLVEKHDDLSAIIDQLLPHVLGILDQNGEVEYLSPSWYLYTALTEAQSLRSEWCQAIHPDDMCKMMRAWADTIDNRLDHWTWEARFRRFEYVTSRFCCSFMNELVS